MSAPKLPPYISAEEVVKFLDYKQLFDALEKAFSSFSKADGGVVQPVRQVISVDKYRGFLGVMPAYYAECDALATKLVSIYPHNTDAPTHQAQVYLFDPKNGNLLAIVDGESITAIRTAMSSTIATKHLAAPSPKILAIIGAGVQARSHYQTMSFFYKFDEVRIWNRTLSRAEKLASELGSHVKVCNTVKEAVDNADVICTVTFTQTPILQKDWVKKGAHINAVGACRSDWRELDGDLVKSADIYADSREACLKESGDILLANADIFAEIGEVINGQKQANREKITIFESMGMAVEDVVASKLVYDKYISAKQGEA